MSDNFKKLATVLIILSSLFGVMFGFLVVINVVPMKYVWGGRIDDRSALIVMEAITLLVNLLIIWLVGMKSGIFTQKIKSKNLKIIFVILATVMILNTLGNLVAKTSIEKLFALPTAVSAVGFLILLKDGKKYEQ